MGYGLIGMIIDSVTGERYDRYLDEHLQQPLAMQDSSFSFVSQIGPRGPTWSQARWDCSSYS
jgi:CubicO group peptidase (beta-lactamase class C family)